MGNCFSQARDDRTIKTKTPKAAKPYNISRPTRPDHLHLSEKCAAEPPRQPVHVSSDRGMNSPAELDSVSFYDLCFPDLEKELPELEKEPPEVNYGRKPTLQPQGAPSQAPNPLMRTRPEQPLTPPSTPPRAVLAPPLPPRPPHAQQPSTMALPLPGNPRYLETDLITPLVSEPSWGPMDAKWEEVMLIQRMVLPLNPSKRSQMSYDDYLTAVTAAYDLPPYYIYHIRRAWKLFGGDVRTSLPFCSVAYLLSYSGYLRAGFTMPTTIPAEIRHARDPIPRLGKDVRRRLGHLSSVGCLPWLHSIKEPSRQAEAFVRLCELSITIQGITSFEGHWGVVLREGSMIRLVELSTSDSLAKLMATYVQAWSLDILKGDLSDLGKDATVFEHFNQQIEERLHWLRGLFAFLDNVELETAGMTEKTMEIFGKAFESLDTPKRALLIYMCSRINPRWIDTLIEQALYCFEPPKEDNPGHRSKIPGSYSRNRERRISKLISELIRLGLQTTPGFPCRPYLASVAEILATKSDISLKPFRPILSKTSIGRAFLDEVKTLPTLKKRQDMMEMATWLDSEAMLMKVSQETTRYDRNGYVA